MKRLSPQRHSLFRWLALLAIPLAVITSEALGWWWMHPPEDTVGVRLLAYVFPNGRYGCAERPVEPRVAGQLHFDHGQTGTIQMGVGRMIDVNYFEWNETNATGLGDAFGHPPDLCMGNAGMKVERYLPNRTYALDGVDLVFDTTQFSDKSGLPLYIFKLSWAEGLEGINLLRDGPKSAEFRQFKFKAVARRWRPRFARVLMLGVFGAANEEEAWKLARLNVIGELRWGNYSRKP
jgi:hypothetical protein